MAENTLRFILDAEDRTKDAINSAKKGLEDVKSSAERMKPAFQAMAGIGVAGFTAIAGAIALSIGETIKMEAAQNRLSHILKTSRGATDEQVEALFKQAKALEKIGVVSADSIIQAQAQLATFDLQSESIERMIPSILDYVVAEKGASASTEDLKQLTNGLAQALNGNFASLTRTGFVLDEDTKALIENGTEAERTAALVKVLDSTYKGFNISARDTAEGSLVVLRNEFNNLQETLGAVFLPMLVNIVSKITPIIEKIASWVEENPKLTSSILIISGVLFGLLAVIGLLGLALPSVIAGFFILISPIGLVVLAILALVAVVALMVLYWDEYIKTLLFIWDNFVFQINIYLGKIKKWWNDTWNSIYNYFKDTWEGIGIILSDIWEGIKSTIGSAIDWLMNKIQPFINAFEKVRAGAAWIGEQAGKGVSFIGGLLGGKQFGGEIPRTGNYLLHKGEEVIPAGKLAGAGGLVININGGYFLSENVAEDLGNLIIDKLKKITKF